MADTAGFVRIEDGRSLLLVDASLEAAVLALDLQGRGAIDRVLLRGEEIRGTGRVRSTVLPLPGRSERLHLRPVCHGGLLGGLWGGRILGPGRAVAELEATATLRARGAPVPRVALVAGERRAVGWRAAVGTIFEEGTRNALEVIAARPDRSTVLNAAKSAGAAVRRFHDAGGCHADLHVGNLLVRGGARASEVIVIDLDRARVSDDVAPARRMHEIVRLYRSLRKRGLAGVVGDRGCAAFFGAYVAGDRALRRQLWDCLPRERRRVARHALAYRR